tara:strand:- start:42 stop:614 length:573 start_codon:yes stop_codon:yes gene_type:complete
MKNNYNLLLKICFLIIFIFLIGLSVIYLPSPGNNQIQDNLNNSSSQNTIDLVEKHAQAWIDGDLELLDSLLHEEVVFAYPGRRLNKEQTLADLTYFRDHFRDTKVYINKIIIDGNELAVEWQFASTKVETGHRQVVSDAIIAEVKDNQFIVWKEYLDGRVKLLQATDELFLEEGEEPYPWPLKTKLYQKK